MSKEFEGRLGGSVGEASDFGSGHNRMVSEFKPLPCTCSVSLTKLKNISSGPQGLPQSSASCWSMPDLLPIPQPPSTPLPTLGNGRIPFILFTFFYLCLRETGQQIYYLKLYLTDDFGAFQSRCCGLARSIQRQGIALVSPGGSLAGDFSLISIQGCDGPRKV